MFSKKKRRRTRITMKSGGGYLSGVYDATLAPAGKALAYGSNAVVSRSNALASSVGSTLAYGSNAVVSTGAEIWKQLRKKEGPTNVAQLQVYFRELCQSSILSLLLAKDYYDLKETSNRLAKTRIDPTNIFTNDNILFEANKPIYESYIRLIGPIIANRDYEAAAIIVRYWGNVVAMFGKFSTEGLSYMRKRYEYFHSYKPKKMTSTQLDEYRYRSLDQKTNEHFQKIISVCNKIAIELKKGRGEGEGVIDTGWFSPMHKVIKQKPENLTGIELRQMNPELNSAYQTLKESYLIEARDIISRDEDELKMESSLDLDDFEATDEETGRGLF